MNRAQHRVNNEEGFVLVVALMILVILSLIGIAGLNTSIFEKQIAGNDWNAKRTFYRADGGVSLGSELLEQSFACPDGFNGGVGSQVVLAGTPVLVQARNANQLKLWANPGIDQDALKDDRKCLLDPDFNQRFDAAYPMGSDGALPTVDVGYLYVGGETSVMAGGALQMAAGYEGKGKSSAQGGAAKEMDIYSQYLGPKNSEAIIMMGWRHLIGSEGGTCNY